MPRTWTSPDIRAAYHTALDDIGNDQEPRTAEITFHSVADVDSDHYASAAPATD